MYKYIIPTSDFASGLFSYLQLVVYADHIIDIMYTQRKRISLSV